MKLKKFHVTLLILDLTDCWSFADLKWVMVYAINYLTFFLLLMLNIMYIVLSAFCFLPCLSLSPPPSTKVLPVAPRFMNSGRLSGKQRRMMGKWVFRWQAGSLRGLLFMLLLFPLKQCCCLRERNGGAWGGGGGVPHPNRRHPDNRHASVSSWRQAEWQTHRGTRLLSCLLFPSLSPYLTTPLSPPAPTFCHSALCRTCLCSGRTACLCVL